MALASSLAGCLIPALLPALWVWLLYLKGSENPRPRGQ